VDSLPTNLRDSYARDFHLADDAFYAGRLEATSRGWQKYWNHWQQYTAPVGVDPYLQDASFQKQIRLLSGFGARVRTGFYGKGNQVKNCTVSSALTAVGQTIALACDANPIKVVGSERLLPRLQVMLDGYRKVDPPTRKKLPVQADVVELLVDAAYQQGSKPGQQATADLSMIAFYYLLRVGEYTIKDKRNNTKQTVQFKFEDVSFYKKNSRGNLRYLPRDASDELIMMANGATLKLDNQKNGWKGVFVYHEANGDSMHCPVRAIARRFLHLRSRGAAAKTFLSAYYDDMGKRDDVTNEDVSRALKSAATVLDYPTAKGIPIDRIDTHSLRSGGANALSLAGYSDTQIQKMGRWCGATFKEYILEELACFSEGMSRSMKRTCDFVNIASNAFNTITDDILDREYEVNVSAPSAA
jgi:hypothetical protein